MNQTLAGLIADVITLTNRPDLAGVTLLAVRNATLKAHGSDYYYKDIAETGVMFDLALTQQNLEYKTLAPRWRSLSYVRKYYYSEDSSMLSRPGEFLTVLTPNEILDTYSIAKEDVCYVAGFELSIRTRAACKYFLLGAYVFPDVTEDNYCSWIANEKPAAILYEAAAIVFKTIGFDEQTAAYRQMVAEEYAELRQSNILANGY